MTSGHGLFKSEPIEEVLVEGGYVPGICDEGALMILKETIGLLARAVASARARPEPADPTQISAARCVLGLGVMAIGEAQAAMVLFSAGLDRPARVHLRSLYEYKIRGEVVSENKEVADNFLAAAAFETRKLGKDLGFSDEVIEKTITEYGIPEGAVPAREQNALGGSMRSIIEKRSGAQDYALFFARPSLMSHGSILALHEVSKAIEGHGSDFPKAAVSDGSGNQGVIQTAMHAHALTWLVCRIWDVGGIAAPLATLIKRNDAKRNELRPAGMPPP